MRTITNNEVLFTCKANVDGNVTLSLHKQSYSDGTCFYTLQDARGNWKVEYGSHDLNKLIKQLKREIKIESVHKEKDYYKTNEAIKEVYDEIEIWRLNIINEIKKFLNNSPLLMGGTW
jgi:aspartyl-tRNA synthetase